MSRSKCSFPGHTCHPKRGTDENISKAAAPKESLGALVAGEGALRNLRERKHALEKVPTTP